MSPSIRILLLFDEDVFSNPLEQFIITENNVQITTEDPTDDPLITEG